MAHRTRGVILDIDGTLIDSNDAHAEAWVETLEEFGFTVPFERVRPLIGKGGDKVLPELTGVADDSPEGERIKKRRGEVFDTEYLPNIKPFPKTRDLLVRMRDAGLDLAVATSASGKELDPLLEVAGAKDLIEDASSSADADNSKPDPDIVRAALEKLGHDAADVVMLGDTPYDVEAATRAGVRIVAVRCGGWDDAALGEAVAIYDDPADLLSHFDDSVFAR